MGSIHASYHTDLRGSTLSMRNSYPGHLRGSLRTLLYKSQYSKPSLIRLQLIRIPDNPDRNMKKIEKTMFTVEYILQKTHGI
jgi:hypothetical protein